jgi:hypothetical protein
MSGLEIANRTLQIFFFRIVRHTTEIWSPAGENSKSLVGYKTNGYSIMLFVLPFTGWETDYIFLFKKVHIYIWFKK